MNEELLNEFVNILKEKDIDVDEVLNSFSNKNTSSSEENKKQNSNSSNDFSNIDINTILKLKTVFEKYKNTQSCDVNLLMALKPYMKKSRQLKIDKYAKMLKMAEILKNLDLFGGD